MTEPTLTDPPVSPPPAPQTSRHPRLWATAAAVVVAAAAGAYLAWPAPTTPGTAGTASRGPAVCDMATAYPGERSGVVVHVSALGPDVVTVEINTGATDHRRLVQQLTRHHDGATFAFAETFWGVESITVSSDKLGNCAVPVPDKVR